MTSRYRIGVSIAAVALAGVIATTAVRKHFRADDELDGAEAMTMLMRAANNIRVRTVEGRLSGGFRHKPYVEAGVERLSENDMANLDALKTVSAIEQSLKKRRTPSLEHALGVAFLLLGNVNRAVEELQYALMHQTGTRNLVDAVRSATDGPLLNDLCVALHARGRSADRRFAIEVGDRASTIWRRPESTWNYALAIESIALHESALAVWREHLRLDDLEAWRVESVQRLERSSRKAAQISRKQLCGQLDAAFMAHDREVARAIASAFPQQTMQWFEEKAFAEWAKTRLHRNSDAPQRLEMLVAFADALAIATGDHLMYDQATALSRAARERPDVLDAAAKAHLAYTRCRELYERSEFTGASLEAQRSRRIFESLSLPFSHLSALTIASCAFIRGEYDRATQLASAVTTDATSRFPSAAGRAHWILGLVTIESGDPRDAIRHYSDAVKMFVRTRESGNRAAATALLAQAQDGVGLTDESWDGRYEAFAILPNVDTPRRRHGILIEAAMAAVRGRDFSLARLLLDRAIAIDVEADDSLGLAGALRVRSMLHHLLRDESAATADLSSARQAASRLLDPASHEVFLKRLDTTTALQMLRRDPARALQILAPAQSGKGTLADVAETTLGLSAAYAKDPAAALRQLLSAIDAVEARLTTDERRIVQSPLVAQPLLSLYDEAIAITARSERPSDALLLSERARVSVRRLNGQHTATVEKHWNWPSGSAAIVFYVSDQDVTSWSLAATGIHIAVHRGKANEMRMLAAEAVAELDDAHADAAVRRLGEMLFAPHWNVIAGAERLLIVPDDVLWSVPFAALRSPAGRYLVEDHVIELAGSIGEYMACAHRPFIEPRKALLVGVREAIDSGLQALPEVQREIAQVRRTLETALVDTVEASSAGDLASLAADVSLIHFAGHGIPNTTDPGLSHLALGTNTRLYARDIRTWRLRGRPVVVLSACEGGARRGKHLDPWGSIADAFADAGASAVIAATTTIEDRQARLFAVALYSHLSADDSAHALNQVQRAAVARGARPSAWAPYVHVTGNCH